MRERGAQTDPGIISKEFNAMDIVGDIFAIIMCGTPILILLWFLAKITDKHLNRMRLLPSKSKEKKEEYIKITLLIVMISISLALLIFLIVMAFVPGIISAIPLLLKLIFMIVLLTLYGIFISIFVGLGDVVGAGGSGAKTLKELSAYLLDYFNIKKSKEDFGKEITNSKKKDSLKS